MKQNYFLGGPLVRSLVVGSMLALAAKGQESNVVTRDAAIRQAQAENPEIRVLAADIAAARGAATSVNTWQNPEVSIAPGYKQFRGTSEKQFHGDFGLEQTFEWPGKRSLRRAVAEKSIVVRELALEGFRAQLAVQVRRAYDTLLATREVVALREQRLSLARDFVTAAKKKVEGGYAPEFEATKAEVEVVAAQKSSREAHAQLDAARVTLNALMGRNPSAPLTVVGSLDTNLPVPDQSRLLEQSLLCNPALKVQEAEAARTGLSAESIRKSRLPDFRVGPNIEYTRDEQIFGFGISLPLPFWDSKQGEVASAVAEQKKALAELDKLRGEILRDVSTASQNLAAANESLAFYTPALRDKLKAALDAAAQGYAEGRTPLLLYLETQRTYFELQADYFTTLQNLFAARAELEAAMGISLNQLYPTNTP